MTFKLVPFLSPIPQLLSSLENSLTTMVDMEDIRLVDSTEGRMGLEFPKLYPHRVVIILLAWKLPGKISFSGHVFNFDSVKNIPSPEHLPKIISTIDPLASQRSKMDTGWGKQAGLKT